MNKNDKFYDDVHNYTKYKLIEMIIDKHIDCKISSINKIEDIADDILKVLAVCGLKYYGQIKSRRNKSDDG